MPCRCGHSWTAPASRAEAASATSGSERRGVLEPYVGPVRQDRLDHAGRLGDHGRAGGVGDHSPGPDAVQRADQQGPLQGDEGLEVLGTATPPALRPATQRPETGARGVHEHPVEGVRSPGGAGAVADDDVADGGPQCLPDEHCPVRLPFVGEQAGSPAARPGPRAARPCHRGRRTGPATARRDPRPRPGSGRARPAGTPRPAPRHAPRARPGRRRGHPTPAPPRGARGW